MHKKIVLSCLVAILIISCSKNDDDKKNDDPIFEMEYTKLQSLDQLDATFYYAGIKRGNAKTSLVIPNSKSCRSSEFFGPVLDIRNTTLQYGFVKFKEGVLNCELAESSFFTETSLLREGELFTAIRAGVFVETPPGGYLIVVKERVFRGILEIGFQGEYLRIEDQMSTYKREDPNEKVYLYFKKQ